MIGIDVGGANLKVFEKDSVTIHYCPMWQKAPLTEILEPYCGKKAAVVMSGELADGFSNKNEGIGFIVESVKKAIPDSLFYGTDGEFHEGPTSLLAAANWLASADFLRERYDDKILVDFGSTTTDIVPLNSFESLKGMTDLDRLRKGYLVYTGTLRSTVPSLLRSVVLNGFKTLVSSEYFAQSADAHLVLGNIDEDDYTVPTPDGAETSCGASLQRLSRVVCSDLEEIGKSGAIEIAEAFFNEQINLIEEQVERVMDETGSKGIISAGIGSHIISGIFDCDNLSRDKGLYPDALPAQAVCEVAERTGIF
ncbi:MAG: H4MPT-linked C1 transfer pathway protein [Methanomicrobiaceae archaeon]|nr:H4MPT-linked C1 transfer pathway protein [Methanomicrobiaceae archaeon]